ncbi:M20/M25/M40 family metallo-hydrolase [Geobacter sp. DSM 9736]|uniref:M20/M25/M40 family metallo-hydrolase n=1 Tax=Geobacter sp. DSM 9736 TaxID=1277350 RepID=UPI000B50754D|nr:M20/M25/M40 family metallo-hydrolase [Geobacter sp. DSM 9736]SNB45872.1 tripeptide aminopeptidase [Geobacter sp. DSM 9736]
MIDRNRLFGTFMDICATDSEPKKERLLAEKLTRHLLELGFVVTEDDAGEKSGGDTGNLFGRLEGRGGGTPLLFSCHMDRVSPGRGVRPRIEGDFIVSDGTTVLGADDAAGIAAILEALTAIKERNLPHPTVEVVFTVAEELALVGSRFFDLGRVAAPCCFVLDASGPVGEIVIQAPEQAKIQAVFNGRKAHAGFAPEEGVSAILMAAAAISRMKLLRVDPQTTANIGSISAAGPTNIVPDRCELEAEARSLDPEKLRVQVNLMTEAMRSAAAAQGGSVEITVTSCYPGYTLAEDSQPARRAASAAQRVGLPVTFKSTGGGSDANIFNSGGLPSVVLSCGYEAVHTTAERIALDQLASLADWVLALISDGADGGHSTS